jgi:hypothetical protein
MYLVITSNKYDHACIGIGTALVFTDAITGKATTCIDIMKQGSLQQLYLEAI